MKLFRVVGNLTLSRCHPSFQGATLLATESYGEELAGANPPSEPDLLIVWDDWGAGFGNAIAVSDGGEASNPFKPNVKPVDAYCSAILDTVQVEPKFKNQ